MCLYNTIRTNPKYKENKKNGGEIPRLNDPRVLKVAIGCGNCIECRKQKTNEWKVRLLEDIKTNTTGKFITLTYSTESLKKLINEIPKKIEGYDIDNAVATLSVRRFLERYRKEHKKSLRHWLITELGHGDTEHLHLHGIIWTKTNNWEKELANIEKHWKYGYIWKGKYKKGILTNYVNEATINYMAKYVTKIDFQHKYYKPIILTSDGIGRNYINTLAAKQNKYNGEETKEYYTTREGYKLALPIYWRNKIYSEEEREKLWLHKLDKQQRYVLGVKIDMNKNEWEYERAVTDARDHNTKMGYGKKLTNKEEWERKEYMNELRTLKLMTRIKENSVCLGDASIQKGLD